MWRLFKRGKDPQWLKEYKAGERNFAKRDLNGQSFAGANLDNIYLRGANLQDADFENAHIRLADFNLCDCSGAKFQGAKIEKSYFIGAKFPNCSFKGATLFKCKLDLAFIGNVDFSGSNLGDVSFRDAKLLQSDFSNTPLAMCHFEGTHAATRQSIHESRAWLEGAAGKSVHDLETGFANRFDDNTIKRTLDLYADRKKNVEKWGGQGHEMYASIDSLSEFFASTGLSKGAAADLVRQLEVSANSQNIFISYASADQDVAEGLNLRLSKRGFQVWYAPRKMQGGEEVATQLDRAIDQVDVLLLVLSGASIKSDWVGREVKAAFREEGRRGRKIILPIRIVPHEGLAGWSIIDDVTGTDLAEQIRERFMLDFAKWRDDWRFGVAVDDLAKELERLSRAGARSGEPSAPSTRDVPGDSAGFDLGAQFTDELADIRSMAEAKNPLLEDISTQHRQMFFGGWCDITPLQSGDLKLTCKLCGYYDEAWPGLTAAKGCGDCGLETDTRGAAMWFEFMQKAGEFWTGGERPDTKVVVKCTTCADVVSWSFRDGPLLKCPKCG